MTILFIFGFYEIKIVDTNFNITKSRLKNKIKISSLLKTSKQSVLITNFKH